MKINIRYSGSSVDSVMAVTSKYPRDEFQSPERSTVPSLAFWMDTAERVIDLSARLHVAIPDECTVEFEYQVVPPAGKGKQSHTDVMLWWESTCVGVEVKYTEPPYEAVSKWLRRGSNQSNRLKVLGGWCDLIGTVTGTPCSPASLEKETYQMVHRIASVCSRPERKKHVLYQVFNPKPEVIAYYRQELSRLKQVLSIGSAIGLHIAAVPIQSLPIHRALVSEWKKTGESCATEVISGLVTRDLMSFGQMQFETI